MKRSKKHSYFIWFIGLIGVLIMGGCAKVQVTNNSGSLIHKVKVGSVEFSENLDYCATGCSTGFKRVRRGNRTILLQTSDTSSWLTLGNLGPFLKNKFYSVNIKMVDKSFCAELWQRTDTDSEFNEDTTKQLIQSLCLEELPQPGGPISQVTNNSGTLLHKVKIGSVEFSENLDYCATGCSTGFAVVAGGDNQISLKKVMDAPWISMFELLGPFDDGLMYSVNIIKNSDGTFCAELWQRTDTSGPFNEDTTKVFIESHCF